VASDSTGYVALTASSERATSVRAYQRKQKFDLSRDNFSVRAGGVRSVSHVGARRS